MTPEWKVDFEALIAALIVVIGGLTGLGVAAVRGYRSIRREMKTNHGSTSLGDATDKQTTDIKTILSGMEEVKGDIRGIRRDVGRIDTRLINVETRLMDETTDTNRRLVALEQTQPKGPLS